MSMDYFYDEQIKKYLLQLVRLFSHFQVREYTQSGVKYNRVPCRYGDPSRVVAQDLRRNTENFLNNAPQLTVSIQNLALSRERTQDPMLVDTQQVAEREWDRNQGVYTSEQGNLYTVKRYMPVPYELTIQVDLWTTNTDSKLQIMEQILVLFNPSIQLQSNDNPMDWSNVFEVTLSDISFTNRSIPVGTDDQIDVATLTFNVPIWISPPAKVQRQAIIQRIIADINNVQDIRSLDYDPAYYDFFGSLPADATVVVTPGDYKLHIENASATLIGPNSDPASWQDLIEMQGELTATSRLELNLTDDVQNRDIMVVGSVSANPLNGAELIFSLDRDTLPQNTLSNVNRIVDPRVKMPRSGLPEPLLGQRYLFTEDLSTDHNTVWGITANAGDIVQFNGTEWFIAFDSATTDQAWVTNSFTDTQYTWVDNEWISSWQGTYNPGYFRLIL